MMPPKSCVLAGDERLGDLPVAVAGDQVHEGLARREVVGRVGEDPARRPEVEQKDSPVPQPLDRVSRDHIKETIELFI